MSIKPLVTASNAIAMMAVFATLKNFVGTEAGSKNDVAYVTLDVLPDRNTGIGFTPLDHKENWRRAWVTTVAVGHDHRFVLALIATVARDLSIDDLGPLLHKCQIRAFGDIGNEQAADVAVAEALKYIGNGNLTCGVVMNPRDVCWPVADLDLE